MPEPMLEGRFRLAASTLLQMLGNSDARVAAGVDAHGYRAVKAYVDVLVDFVASGFDAVMTQWRSARRRKAARR
jgi:hypothetical protein